MKFLLDSILGLILIFIAYQDLKFRAVYWFLFPVLLLGIMSKNIFFATSVIVWENAGVNILFISFLLLSLTLYFSLKNRKFINITREYLGLGDILFLICLAFYFSPLNFLLFYIGSSLLVIFFVGLFNLIKQNQLKEIPYAGLQGLMLLILIIVNLAFPFADFSQDDWLLASFI